MRKLLFILLLLPFSILPFHGMAQEALTNYVNPFIGTGGHGHTYPGAVVPFGMVQLSPDTRLDGWDGCSGYHYSDSVIYGFSHTHLSGTGCSDFGDILFMPTVGDVHFNNGSDGKKGYRSSFKKANETAKASYYKVKLDNGNIIVELTATNRAGMHRYIFPKSKDTANIIIDLKHRDEVIEASIKVINDHEIEGMRRSKAWAKDQYVYFVAQFSKPFTSCSVASDDVPWEAAVKEAKGKNIKAAVRYDFSGQDTVVVEVGISAVSCDGARKNLTAETMDFNFDFYQKKASKAWEKELSKIVVKSKDKDKKTIFYTALYHCMLAPNLYSDVDGNYRGMDMQIHHADHDVYNVFSLWDTYRAEHPLLTIIDQKRTADFINTFLKCYDESGRLPVWELAANETDCMIGYHAVPVIVDAFQKGIKGFDTEKALLAMVKASLEKRDGLEAYNTEGYIPSDKAGESVSRTLEYAYDDWCISQYVKLLGNQNYYNSYYTLYTYRAQSWKNIFDPKTNFFRAKRNGSFKIPFDPFEVNFDLTEANTWQYNFYVPQDVTGLMNAMGGRDKFTAKLDELFTAKSKTTGREQSDISGMIGQYAHGNEPSHHIAYLYDYAGQSWETQERVHQIMTTLYANKPDGLSGNEDCGQMSAWYVMSAMGFYPVCPGSGDYAIGTPLFDEVTINLENGKHTRIIASNLSDKNYFIKLMVDTIPLEKREGIDSVMFGHNYLSHSDIMSGGFINFSMTDKHDSLYDKKYGSNTITSSIDQNHLIIPVPYIESVPRTFTDSLVLKCGHLDPKAEILLYTYHGNQPIDLADNTYHKPVVIKEGGKVEIFAALEGDTKSSSVFANFIKLDKNRKIKIISPYSPQYAGDGDNTLIDKIRGGKDFRSGDWQGYEGVGFEAIIDLGAVKDIHKVGLGCLQDIGSWIYYPKEVTFSFSEDGEDDYKLLNYIKVTIQEFDTIGTYNIRYYDSEGLNTKARFIKVQAKNFGIIPDTDPGKGGKSWMFLDEIIIE